VVRDQVRDKLDVAFEDLGEQSVKNIARPVPVFVVRPTSKAGLPMASVSPATSSSPPAAAPRLSIVVLPFTNLSDDREQQYFADGITEDLTTDLSRLENMLVISRNTAFTYRNKPIDTKQIGRELCVRYVLEGSVRRSANQVRISAQLIDAATDAHLWAERFDCDTGDLFALQNEIASRLANTLGVELIAAEAARPAEHPDAFDYILRARARNNFRESISMIERALALDPQSTEAQCQLAHLLTGRVLTAKTDSAPADLARAEGLVDQALVASPRYAFAHFVKGQVLRAQQRCEEATAEYEAAIALNRNLAGALSGLAWCKLDAGSIEQVIPLAEQAIRLSPRDPQIGVRYYQIGIVHLLQSHPDMAVAWLEKARSAMPTQPNVRGHLASAYALKGVSERAAAELAEFTGGLEWRRLCSGTTDNYRPSLLSTLYGTGLKADGLLAMRTLKLEAPHGTDSSQTPRWRSESRANSSLKVEIPC
jgi:TolB-like protein